ncbi:hypothetical protein [Frankia nepalensis]|uniref:hypothetical protein n=1 Tax=Frankia nepalensis TaxID=1836974 RepID=UPI001EE3F652|nr:hypothetical protein [Frankia nepalensis]
MPPRGARGGARTRRAAARRAAIIAVDGRARPTLDDMERADALADALLARRRGRVSQAVPELA